MPVFGQRNAGASSADQRGAPHSTLERSRHWAPASHCTHGVMKPVTPVSLASCSPLAGEETTTQVVILQRMAVKSQGHSRGASCSGIVTFLAFVLCQTQRTTWIFLGILAG